MLPQAFVAAGIVLLKLRERSRNANECFDFDELELEEAKRASVRTYCSSESLDCLDADAANECMINDESLSCRFCFAGPERGELISPCACVGSQEFVHTRCLRQWQKIAMRTKGNRELNCRVCHAPFTIPHSLGPGRLRIWFSLRARDRLNEYTRVWFQALVQIFFANKRAVAPAVVLAKSASAQDLALMLCSTEVKIWAGREARRGHAAMTSLRALSWFGTGVRILTKLKELGVVGGA